MHTDTDTEPAITVTVINEKTLAHREIELASPSLIQDSWMMDGVEWKRLTSDLLGSARERIAKLWAQLIKTKPAVAEELARRLELLEDRLRPPGAPGDEPDSPDDSDPLEDYEAPPVQPSSALPNASYFPEEARESHGYSRKPGELAPLTGHPEACRRCGSKDLGVRVIVTSTWEKYPFPDERKYAALNKVGPLTEETHDPWCIPCYLESHPDRPEPRGLPLVPTGAKGGYFAPQKPVRPVKPGAKPRSKGKAGKGKTGQHD